MFKKLLELFRAQVFLARDVQENKEKIALLRREVDELAEVVVRLQHDVQMGRSEEKHEREKVLLRIENSLLKFERVVGDAKSRKKRK